MKLSTVLGIRRRRIRNRIFTIGFIVSGMLSIAVAVVTFYGQNAGNFVMSVDTAARQRGIVISESPDFSDKRSRLMSDPIEEAREITYAWLKLEEVEATNGNYIDPDHDYVAYTFYLKNNGLETVDLTYYIRITEVYRNLDAAIRILVIEDGIETMYMKEDLIETEYPDIMPKTVNFETSNTVMRNMIYNFRPGQEKKFSVLIWLEGYDLDTNDDIIGGMIRMQMNFSIFSSE